MEKPTKFALPSPNFQAKVELKTQPHYLTPSGMTLLPREKQPPPMFGPKGTTVPSKFFQQQNEKPKEETDKLPFCEPCEMELQSMADFRGHRSQHESCPVEGCKFKGHPTVMDKHVTELHASGVFEKIQKLSTPEEIAAWREERRKKYPTLANAKMRQLAQEQRQRRGERLEENKSRFGRREDRKRARTEHNKAEVSKQNRTEQSKRRRNNDSHKRIEKSKRSTVPLKPNKVSSETKTVIAELKEAPTEETVHGVRMFKGTSKMKDYVHEKSKTEKAQTILTSFVGMYGSDDDLDSETEDVPEEKDEGEISNKQPNNLDILEEKITDKDESKESSLLTDPVVEENPKLKFEEKPDQIISADTKQKKQFTKTVSEPVLTPNEDNCDIQSKESSDEGPEEVPIERTTTMPEVVTTETPVASGHLQPETIEAKRLRIEQSRKSLQEKRQYGLNYRKTRLRKQNTMLEKLLEPEIRHERNVLLQCVRYVCENNFFGIGSTPSVKENECEIKGST